MNDDLFQSVRRRLAEDMHHLARHVADVQLFELSEVAAWGRMAAMKRGSRR